MTNPEQTNELLDFFKALADENRLKIDFVIRDAFTGEKLSKAYTVQVAVDMKSREMCYVSPPVLREKLCAFRERERQLGATPAPGLLA